MRKLILAAVAALAIVPSARADTITGLGINPTSGAGAFANGNPGTGGGGSGVFVDLYTFDLVGSQILTIAFATNTYAGGDPQFITNFQGSVFFDGANGVPGGGDDVRVIGPDLAQACLGVPQCQTFGGSATLPGGSYYLAVSGDAGVDAGYGGNLSTFAAAETPLPPAVVMFLTGLLGLGGMIFGNNKKKLPQAWSRYPEGDARPA